jgi:hypothetical protein
VNTEEFLASLGDEEKVMDKRFGHSRKFLNKRSGLAAVEWRVTGSTWVPTRGKDKKKHVEVVADFTITDCNRQVTLDFSVWDKKDLKAKLQKVRDLQDEINAFASDLEDAIVWAEGQA